MNSITERVTYKNGKKNGPRVLYYPDTLGTVGADIIKKGVSFQIAEPSRMRQVGMYDNDRCVGEWVTLDFNGNLVQKYNFDNSKLKYDISIKDSSLLNTNRLPLFIGGEDVLRDVLNKPSHFNAFKKINKDTTIAAIRFIVDELGNTSDIIIENIDSNDILKKEIIDLISSTNGRWIPALKEGNKTRSVYSMTFEIIRIKTDTRLSPVFLSIFKISK